MKYLKEDIQELAQQLYRIAFRRLKNEHDAEDVVQDVFLKLFSNGSNKKNIDNTKAYAIKSTINRSLDMIKRKGRIYEEITEESKLSNNQQNPLHVLAINDSYLLAKQAMNDLPEMQKKVIQLRDIEELSYEEIAIALDINMNQVKVYLHRGRKQLRAKLSKKALYEN